MSLSVCPSARTGRRFMQRLPRSAACCTSPRSGDMRTCWPTNPRHACRDDRKWKRSSSSRAARKRHRAPLGVSCRCLVRRELFTDRLEHGSIRTVDKKRRTFKGQWPNLYDHLPLWMLTFCATFRHTSASHMSRHLLTRDTTPPSTRLQASIFRLSILRKHPAQPSGACRRVKAPEYKHPS